jgi:hypothetical protein
MSGVVSRITRNWRALTPQQQLAAIAALALLFTMVLPWYQETGVAVVKGKPVAIADSKNAFQVYSFVEAAVFVVAVGVLGMLWARAEGKAFHLPGGDGTVIMGAGLWVMFLIFYRQLDKPNGRHEGQFSTTMGVQWGIFIAFLVGAGLAYSGYRIRAAHVPEPVTDETPEPPPAPPAGAEDEPAESAPTAVARPRRPPDDDRFDAELSFDEPSEYRPPPRRR